MNNAPVIHDDHPDNRPAMLEPPPGTGFTDAYFALFLDGLDLCHQEARINALKSVTFANCELIETMQRLGIKHR